MGNQERAAPWARVGNRIRVSNLYAMQQFSEDPVGEDLLRLGGH
jgi:hypothetical protein